MIDTPFTAEDLYLYSMHLMEPEEGRRLEEFLQRSSEARAELQNVRGDLAYLALAAEPVAVPDLSRHRLLNQIAREPRTAPVPAKAVSDVKVTVPQATITPPMPEPEAEDRYTPAPRLGQMYEQDEPHRGFFARLFPWAGWAVAAGLGFTAWTFYQRNLLTGSRLADARVTATQLEEKSARAETVLETLRSPQAQRFLLTAQGTPPVPSARVTYLAASGSLVFQGSDLEAVPGEKTYELWLIPAEKDAKPIPAGTFKPD